MRSIINALLLFATFLAFSQRQSFQDPDLSWSFKKPRNWALFDNGLVVKVSPSVQDSASTFLTMTYFESARAFGGMNAYGPANTPPALEEKSSNTKDNSKNMQRIGSYTVEYNMQQTPCNQDTCLQKRYSFMHHGQRWEIITSEPVANQETLDKKFRKMIRSLRID